MKKKKKIGLLIKDTILCTLLSFMVIFALSFLIVNISFFNPFKKVVKDFSFLDVYYAENLNENNSVEKDIVLINIEHRDRFELAQLIESVQEANPKVIGIDIIFKDKKDEFLDSVMATALNNDNIVTSYIIQKDEIISNHPMFYSASPPGFVTFNFDDEESVVREFVGVTQLENEIHRSFATQIVKKVLSDEVYQEYNYDKVLIGNTVINYHGDYSSFLTFGYDEFMLTENKSVLTDKIVLLGYLGSPTGSAFDVEDKLFTPLNKITAGKSVPDMFGVVIHANIISMLLKNNLTYRFSNFWISIFTFICSFFMIMYFIVLTKRGKLTFRMTKQMVLFLFTIFVSGLGLWLFKMGIILKVAPIIGITILSSSFVKHYKDLIELIKTKRKWKSYIK